MTSPEKDRTGGNMLPVMLSAIQHYSYCRRQCALIHVEQQFAENVSTQRGNAVHRLVDKPENVQERGIRVDRALPLYSHEYGLTGKADVVEWHGALPYPVEYKKGSRKSSKADELQLAAQAICLEEMTGHAIAEGAIYHHDSRRRRKVDITKELKQEVISIAYSIRELYGQNNLPPAVNDSRCNDCSLYEICQPKAIAKTNNINRNLKNLFTIEDEEL